jgi:hypothetical protein
MEAQTGGDLPGRRQRGVCAAIQHRRGAVPGRPAGGQPAAADFRRANETF